MKISAPCARRIREVGHRHGVLGADVAAGAAIAAQRAGRLRDARRVHSLIEAHHHGRCDRCFAEACARRFERAKFAELAGLRVTRGTKHRRGALESLREQPVAAHLLGPGRIGEHARVGLKRNARIDEGAAAEPAADQHVDVRAEPEIEQPSARAGAHLAAVQLQLAAKLRQAARELAGEKLLALLDDADALAGARQPRGRDATAIAGADHDHVIGRSDRARR